MMQDDYFDQSQSSKDIMTYLELTEHEVLRKLLPKRVVDVQYEFMYSGYNIDYAKQDWAEIVERIEEVTKIRANADGKSKRKDAYKRKKWGGMYVPKLPDENEE
jgi:hypothetical protein